MGSLCRPIRVCILVIALPVQPQFGANKLAVARAPGYVLGCGIEVIGKLPGAGALSASSVRTVLHFQIIAHHYYVFSGCLRCCYQAHDHPVGWLVVRREDGSDTVIVCDCLGVLIAIKYDDNAVRRVAVSLIEEA
jgi:hypothetical protein